jgi:hypothetical protein
MNGFEGAVMGELTDLLRAGVPARGVRITVRELMVTRMERGPLGAREVHDAMEAMVRAACRLVREQGAPEEIVDLVCRAALDAVRGHGGESARWLSEATATADATVSGFGGR